MKGKQGKMELLYYVIALIFGVLFGSFLNVLILRIPEGEDFVREPSHCPQCGKHLEFYELIPIISYVIQKGRCRGCYAGISVQYPLIEGANSLLWLLIFWQTGFSLISVCYALVASLLLAISVIDVRTMEIAPQLNMGILILGVVITILDRENFLDHIIGMVLVSSLLILVFVSTNGKGMGGGDVKLMATCGLVLGWQYILLAFVLGCMTGGIVHSLRMKVSADVDNRLALGPYLSLGVLVSMLWGTDILIWYIQDVLGQTM